MYFATSKNGIDKWKIHEDSPCLNPSKDDGNWFYFDSEHVGMGCVIIPGETGQSKINTQDGVFLMYTCGGRNDECELLAKDMSEDPVR